MPTLPSPPPPPSPPEAYLYRQMAESFGVDAARYDRTRPPYPQALIDRVLAASPGTSVLDVGCGTGIAARQFQAAGASVLGIEPDTRMAEFARASGVAVEVATFEDWDSTGRTFDSVVAGTAWHWVDPVAGADQAARVLRTGGLLVPFWHVFQPPAAVAEAFAVAFQRVVPDSPLRLDQLRRPAVEAYQAAVDRVTDGMRAAARFSEPQHWRWDWERSYTREEWLDQLPTTGGLTRLAPEQLAQVLGEVGAAIDDLGGSFTMQYSTVAVAATRTG